MAKDVEPIAVPMLAGAVLFPPIIMHAEPQTQAREGCHLNGEYMNPCFDQQ